MSADLLAEFSTFYQVTEPSQPARLEGSTASSVIEQRRENSNYINESSLVEDDDFGDFEDATHTESSYNQAANRNFVSARRSVHESQTQRLPNQLQHDGSDFQHTGSVNEFDYNGQRDVQLSHPGPPLDKLLKSSKHGPANDNVLFDAEDEISEDDFGDFEQTGQDRDQPSTIRAPLEKQPLSSLLIDLDETPVPGPVFSPILQQASQLKAIIPSKTGSQPTIIENTEHHSISSPNSHETYKLHSLEHAVAVVSQDDVWDDFEPPSNSVTVSVHETRLQTHNNPNIPTGNPSHVSSTDGVSNTETISPTLMLNPIPPNGDQLSASVPPPNIPSPTLLLRLFPPLLAMARTQLFDPLHESTNSSQTGDAILASPNTRAFLTSYLAVATVLAHIVAGRKLRWKRDTLLAQNFRIGPASSKSSGMKLAGIDKAEMAKEDREVADVVRLWKAQLGHLRSAVSRAAASNHVPEVAEVLAVRTAKEIEGGITSPRACALCGLRRNERVIKVDFEVQDSFGEWWGEHWGHRTCMNFWFAQEQNLEKR